MTYKRYKDALEAIATGGVDDPVGLAAAVLKSRKPIAKPKTIQPKLNRETGKDRAIRNYHEWIAAGKPRWDTWGKTVGLAPSTAARWVNEGKRHIEWKNYLHSQEHKQWCDEQIAYTGWQDFKETWGWRSELYEKLWGIPDDSHSEYFLNGNKWEKRSAINQKAF